MPSIKLLPAMLLFASALAVPVLDNAERAAKEVLDVNVDGCATCEKPSKPPSSCIIHEIDYSSVAFGLVADINKLTTACPLYLDVEHFTELLQICCDDMEHDGSDNNGECALETSPVNSTDLNPVTFDTARWIWTHELDTSVDVPYGSRPFRRTVHLPPTQIAEYADVLITTDNAYSLYINGKFIGTGTEFRQAHRYKVTDIQSNKIVIAVYGQNYNDSNGKANPAGVLASVRIVSKEIFCQTDCECGEYVTSVDTDKCFKTKTAVPPTGFEKPNFDDSTWDYAVAQGVYGTGAQGSVAIDTTYTMVGQGSPLSGGPEQVQTA